MGEKEHSLLIRLMLKKMEVPINLKILYLRLKKAASQLFKKAAKTKHKTKKTNNL